MAFKVGRNSSLLINARSRLPEFSSGGVRVWARAAASGRTQYLGMKDIIAKYIELGYPSDPIQATALRMLLQVYDQAVDRHYPLLELIVKSLVDEGGALKPFPGMDLDQENLNQFLQLMFEDPERMQVKLLQIMEAEGNPVPQDHKDLPDWAEDLVLLLLEARGDIR